MKPSLDELLREEATRPSARPSSADALVRAREAARAELRGSGPPPSWRRQAAWLVAGCLGVVVLVASVMLAAGATDAEVLRERAPLLALLALSLCVGLWAALSPSRSPMRPLAGVLAVFAVGAVTFWRFGTPSDPGAVHWVCTAGQVGAAIPGVVAAGWLLRGFEPGWGRALLLGIGVGATGAMVGELACGQGFVHVVVFHVGAWLTLAGALLVWNRKVRRRAFAP